MLPKIRKFIELSSEEKKLFLEAYVALGIIRVMILTISFKKLTRSLEHTVKKEEMTVLNDKEISIAVKVSQAITKAAAYTPWESACLVQSLAAYKMLQKRRLAGVFYLGAMKDKKSKDEIQAHSWSQCGDIIVTGQKGHEKFTVLSAFGWEKK